MFKAIYKMCLIIVGLSIVASSRTQAEPAKIPFFWISCEAEITYKTTDGVEHEATMRGPENAGFRLDVDGIPKEPGKPPTIGWGEKRYLNHTYWIVNVMKLSGDEFVFSMQYERQSNGSCLDCRDIKLKRSDLVRRAHRAGEFPISVFKIKGNQQTTIYFQNALKSVLQSEATIKSYTCGLDGKMTTWD